MAQLSSCCAATLLNSGVTLLAIAYNATSGLLVPNTSDVYLVRAMHAVHAAGSCSSETGLQADLWAHAASALLSQRGIQWPGDVCIPE